MQEYPWIKPAILLLVLLLLLFFRWDTVYKKSYDNGFAHWKVDRWTGQMWVSVSMPDNDRKLIANKYPIGSTQYTPQQTLVIRSIKTGLSIVWVITLVFNLLWLNRRLKAGD